MARSVKPTRTSRIGLRRRTSEDLRKTAVEETADQKAEAQEEQGTADTVTAVSGETGAGTRTRPHVATRGVPADGKDADIRHWRETSASPLRRAQRRCVLSGVVHVARMLDVTATAKTRAAGGILRPADGVGGYCGPVAERTKAIRAFPVAHLQHLASPNWDYGIRTLQARKSNSFGASTVPQVVARFSRRVSSHGIILDSYCSRRKEEPGGSYRDRTTTSLPHGRRSPQEP